MRFTGPFWFPQKNDCNEIKNDSVIIMITTMITAMIMIMIMSLKAINNDKMIMKLLTRATNF